MITITFWHWFGIAIVLLVAEMLGAAGFLLWTGMSAALIGVLVFIFPGITPSWQLVIFSLTTFALIYVWWQHLQKRINASEQPYLNQRSTQYIGRQTTLVEALVNGRGTVRIDDSRWQVTGPDMPKGTVVKVVSLDDAMLLRVESLNVDEDQSGPTVE